MAGNLHAAHSNAVIHTHADLASACPGGGGAKAKQNVIRSNFKLFHLYFANYLVKNIIFSAIF